MLYLYLDESGDLGFDFVNKKQSKFYEGMWKGYGHTIKIKYEKAEGSNLSYAE